ncbi:hypothetical protein [Paenibacillus lautus]|nr:hypothetical protein [Paenibacillus lautus]
MNVRSNGGADQLFGTNLAREAGLLYAWLPGRRFRPRTESNYARICI